jgi:lipopolysaccharide/colanic/teichoic acid biosynthesis glycosyltransferase
VGRIKSVSRRPLNITSIVLMQGRRDVANRNKLKPVQRLDRFRRQPSTDQVSRFGDVVIAAMCLVITAPLFLLVSIAVKLEAPGPVFERRGCVGRRGRFDKLEFRTTVFDPEKHNTMWTRRPTPIGELLRYTRIDALPQIVNVLRGEMSLLHPDGDLTSFLD